MMRLKNAAACVTATLIAVFTIQTLAAASNGSRNLVPQDVFDGMRQSFQADKAKGVYARYQFDLEGPNGGDWWIDVTDGKFKMEKGKIDNPNVTLIASDKDWVALANDQLSGTWAYLTGRLKIRGDRKLAKKLGEMFP